MAIVPVGKVRLADAHCERGSVNQRAQRFTEAVADFEEAIALGATTDGCSCEPYNPLLGLYLNEKRDHDKAWKTVRRAFHKKQWMAPELLEQLRRDSGRTQ